MNKSLVIWLTVGGSSGDNSMRRLGWGLPSRGWNGATTLHNRLDRAIVACRNHGLRPRVLLHNPWGHTSGEPMDFDQRLEAMGNDQLDAIDDFEMWADSWLRHRLGIDGELIVYVGTPTGDADMRALERDPEAYRSRWHRALLGVPKWAGLAIDATSKVTDSDPAYGMMLLERNAGRRVYIEARPHKNSDVIGWPVICDARFWDRSDPAMHADSARWAASNAEAEADEVIRFILGGSVEQQQQLARRVLGAGHTLSLGLTAAQTWGSAMLSQTDYHAREAKPKTEIDKVRKFVNIRNADDGASAARVPRAAPAIPARAPR